MQTLFHLPLFPIFFLLSSCTIDRPIISSFFRPITRLGRSDFARQFDLEFSRGKLENSEKKRRKGRWWRNTKNERSKVLTEDCHLSRKEDGSRAISFSFNDGPGGRADDSRDGKWALCGTRKWRESEKEII